MYTVISTQLLVLLRMRALSRLRTWAKQSERFNLWTVSIMAVRDGQGAVGGRDPENELIFAQRKLEDNYGKVYRQLDQWRGALVTIQEVLAWKRPVPAALLYLAVHWLF